MRHLGGYLRATTAFIALALFAFRRDLLQKRGLHVSGSAWSEADSASADLERARHLF